MPPNTVKVDRSTRWGNPWRVGRDGDAAYCVKQYRLCLIGQPVDSWPETEDDALDALHMGDLDLTLLKNKSLACWCKPGAVCHADVLLELANDGGEG
jgi:hypothetical protein